MFDSKKTLSLSLKIAAASAAIAFFIFLFQHFNRFPRYQKPPFLSFSDLQQLSKTPSPSGLLKLKLERYWRTPLISNEAYYSGEKPFKPEDEKLGPYLRVVSWNVEKSYQMENAVKAFSDKEEFVKIIDPGKAPEGSKDRETVLRQRERLANADIILLQEMDYGVKRSGYINAAGDLAKAMKMNYAYGTEQLEVDPVVLGLEELKLEDGSPDTEAMEYYKADPSKYKGAFGVAVLSRYPIKRAQVFQLKNQAYDWGEQEKLKHGFFEDARRAGAKWVFKNEITREVKAGGRIYFRVDLEVPGLPGNTLTIINVHLEIKCLPEGREKQMEEILYYIQNIRNPVIMAGDFNAAPEDLSATSAKRIAVRTAKNPTTWLSAAVSVLLPQALIINTTRFTSNFTKNLQDPLASDIAVIAPNPLHPLFAMIQNYRFKDGKSFDFRGNGTRSINGKSGTLANSNERDMKGFKTTFSVKRPVAAIFGKYRLDWFFVKSFVNDPFDISQPYRFAPHFGETLEELNTSVVPPISDHHPSVVDFPFKEPKLTN